MLKGGNITGWRSGPFLSATNNEDGRNCLNAMLEKVDSNWLRRKKEDIERDRDMAMPRRLGVYEQQDPDDFSDEELLQEWKNYNDGVKPERVKNKVWYRMLESFRGTIAKYTFMRGEVKSTYSLLHNSGDKMLSDSDHDEEGDGAAAAKPVAFIYSYIEPSVQAQAPKPSVSSRVSEGICICFL